MTYVLPQVRVFQDYSIRPAALANTMSACLIGGNAHLVRVSEPDEKPDGLLGDYDGLTDTDYLWPNRPAGAQVDLSYTKVFIENALLQYFTDSTGSGSTIVPVAGYTNRIRSNTLNFKTANGYIRNSGLYSRDVQPGDVVRVRGTPTGPGADGAVTMWTYVRSLVADNVNAVFGDIAEDSNNAATQSASVSITQTAGDENWIEATATGTAYDGTPDGYTSESYVIRVIDGSVEGDLTTATLRVLSASGTDDQFGVVPAAAGSPTSIGTRGLTVTFDLNAESESSASWSETEFGSSDLVAGQEFTVSVSQAYKAQDMALGTGAAYAGTRSTTYVVEFIRGGLLANSPAIVVTTTDGSDQSGPHTVTGADVTIPIGTQGVTIKFPNTEALSPLRFNKGDRFYLPVTGVQEGPVRTIVLGDSLPASFTTSDEIGIELYARQAMLEVSENRAGMAPEKNWEQTATEITLNAGITAYVAELHDAGVPIPLDVYAEPSLGYGKVYVEYRAWLPELCGSVLRLSDVSEIDQIPGVDSIDNPLKFNAKAALANNNGVPVYLVAVCDPDSTDSWAEALSLSTAYDAAYNIVPLTFDSAVHSLVQAHVNAQSSPNECLWRGCVIPLTRIPETPIVAAGSTVPGYTAPLTSDGDPALAVFEDDPNTSGTQYTRVRISSGNASLLTLGVRAGDILRGVYTGDGFGDYTHQEFVIDDVESETVLRLQTGPSTPYDVPAKIEVWRTLTATEEATEIGRRASSFGSNRVCAIWPDALDPTYALAATSAIGGLASGVLPHQGLTNVAISGLSTYVQETSRFGKAQLDIMASMGVWIIDRTRAGIIRTRHAVTTADYNNINLREEMLRRNFDNVSYRYKDFFAPYIGVTNVTSSMENQIRADFAALTSLLKSERATLTLGGQVIDATLVRFEASELFRDRYNAYISLELPYALNNLDLYLALV